MSGIRLGDTPITRRYLGDTPITRTYLGDTLIWEQDSSGPQMRDYFNLPNGPLDPTKWIDEGPSPAPSTIVNGQMRLEIPDGFLIIITPKYSRHRYNAISPNVDYEMEFRIGSLGDPAHATYVLARLSNSSFTHGIGIQVMSSTLVFVRRVANTYTPIKDAGSFAIGDVCRLRGIGNQHMLRVNGRERTSWKDTLNVAASGANYRGLGIEQSASKSIFGPRMMSPSIDYVALR